MQTWGIYVYTEGKGKEIDIGNAKNMWYKVK